MNSPPRRRCLAIWRWRCHIFSFLTENDNNFGSRKKKSFRVPLPTARKSPVRLISLFLSGISLVWGRIFSPVGVCVCSHLVIKRENVFFFSLETSPLGCVFLPLDPLESTFNPNYYYYYYNNHFFLPPHSLSSCGVGGG